jgi:hypothetical protein
MKTDILLSGLVSGLTILLGVIVADWLKRLRDRIEASRRTASVILETVQNYVDYLSGHILVSVGSALGVERSRDEKEFLDIFAFLTKELEALADLPRWPQPDAKKMRRLAHQLFICVVANLYHCGTKKILMHSEDAKELNDLAYDLRDLTRTSLDRRTLRSSVPEKREELERRALSRAVVAEG